jgi:pimeloyl-ACP methyl ester carboxylesterase
MTTLDGAGRQPAVAFEATIRGVHREPLAGILVAVSTAAVLGLVTAAVMPRGPATSLQGLLVIGSGLIVGAIGGACSTTRWAGVAAILGYGVAFEAGRAGAVGPTVDGIRLDNAYGVLAFALGRGFHLSIAALALLLGASMGRRLAVGLDDAPRRPARGGLGTMARALPTAILGLAVAALTVAIAWPASTPPVLGPDGRPVPGSISELATVRLGGVDQTVMIRAANPDAPVLLYLAGGPGQSDLALTRVAAEPWVDDVVFVDWDQRGTGKSYAAMEPASTLTLEQAVSDTIDLSEILRDRFDERRIYLMGESWGSILGVLAVQRRPDLYYAWIGSGQMVNVVETDRRVYRDLVDYAARTGDGTLAARLAEIGEPPYRDIPWANANLLAWYEYLYAPYTPSLGYLARGEAAGLDPFGILGSEYNLVEKTAVLRGLIDAFALMYPQLYGIDVRRDAARLEVPVYLLDGAAELAGRRDLALDWFAALDAPSKTQITFEGAAHSVAFEQADAVDRLLVERILPETYRP